ncbi:hypothetical protein QKU48_gp0429 [Fadolivirus algeromassiliense]|jgi:hypothetical protein|uniref:Uncharacterized protein n=1 Tax=Fadolivirus FV1/VV64 TaxID=3070911 RepID=A0A7D3QU55_9VIRU|nr:hypothetical protein QKU48_gp0429 [Fadolivirus algeromassiliense]QKF93887.1 hypothetical protein Fadolivirus_1_429 [Fadolivirus FV1/VV64]
MKNIKFYILIENINILDKTIDCAKSLHTENSEVNLIFYKNYKFIPKFNSIDNIFNLHHFMNKSQLLNFCVINAFHDFSSPKTKVIAILNNNILLDNTCYEYITDYHNIYDLIQLYYGGDYISFTVNVPKKIGLFDEGFCDSDYMIADYYLNAKLNNINISVNDLLFNLTLNSIPNIGTYLKPELITHIYDKDLLYFNSKWGSDVNINNLKPLAKTYTKKYKIEDDLIIDNVIQQPIQQIPELKPIIQTPVTKIPKQIEQSYNEPNTNQTTQHSKILYSNYAIKNVKTKQYISVDKPEPTKNNCIILSDNQYHFFIYQDSRYLCNTNNWLISILDIMKNQNDTLKWHLYATPSDNKLYGAGNNGEWAHFKFEKIDNYYRIKTNHNIKNCKDKFGRYLWIDGNILRTDGDNSMDETLWLLE